MDRRSKSGRKTMYEIHLVAHTHWDREWYNTFQEFRIQLVKLTNKLLHIFETEPDYKCFVFDGQTIVLEDYLEIYPEKKNELRKYVKEGRLHIGPWYILPDEFLVSGESLIRNLLIGHKIASEFGKVMKAGYLPDPFGHISQLPQIFQGFNIDSIIFTRGLGSEGEKLGSEFIWQAPDKSEIIAIHQIEGYCNAASLGYVNLSSFGKNKLDYELGYKRTVKLLSILKKYARTNYFLFNNGCDHLEPEPELPKMIKYINSKLTGGKIIHSNYCDFIRKIKRVKNKLIKHKGELRKARYAALLPNVLSARMYIKQKNFDAQNLIEKYAEPLSSFAYLEGKEYPSNLLEKSWKYLIQSHPHDSICGCSIDKVHHEVVQRFEWSMQICNSIIKENFNYLVEKGIKENKQNPGIAVFNTLPWKRKEEVIIENEEFEVDVPACGYKVYKLSELKNRKIGREVSKELTLENDYIKIEVSDNGTLKIIDKNTKFVYDKLNFFEDTEDCGDEYNYSQAENSCTFTTLEHKPKIVKKNDKLEILYEFHIPESIADDRKSRHNEKVPCPLKTTINLDKYSPKIKIETEFDNKSKDHRLRVGFNPNITTDYTLAEGQFDIIKRSVDFNSEDWVCEPPIGTFPQQNFVLIKDKGNGLILVNKGLPEYELTKEKGLYLTLLRSVGWLSRSDLLTRKGHTGPFLPTPEAQCLGINKFEYALIPFSGNWQEKLREIYDYIVPLWTYQTSISEEKEKSYFSLEPTDLLLSAIKKSEKRKSIIVRIFNPAENKISGKLKIKQIKKARLVNLNEEPIKNLNISGENIRFQINPFQILSIEIFSFDKRSF